MGIAPDIRIVETGSAWIETVSTSLPFVEDALRAVAVVDVDVEDRDALVAEPQMGGCDRAVVEKAKTAGDIAKGVMAGRTAQRVDGIFTVQHHLRR